MKSPLFYTYVPNVAVRKALQQLLKENKHQVNNPHLLEKENCIYLYVDSEQRFEWVLFESCPSARCYTLQDMIEAIMKPKRQDVAFTFPNGVYAGKAQPNGEIVMNICGTVYSFTSETVENMIAARKKAMEQ